MSRGNCQETVRSSRKDWWGKPRPGDVRVDREGRVVKVLGLKYSPDQPRVPAGESTGGRWTSAETPSERRARIKRERAAEIGASRQEFERWRAEALVRETPEQRAEKAGYPMLVKQVDVDRWRMVVHPNPWLEGAEKEAVDYYKGKGYASINRALRAGEKLSKKDKAVADTLDRLIGEGETPENTTILRGLNPENRIGKMFGELKGRTLVDNGFLSTTYSETTAKYFNNWGSTTDSSKLGVMLEIRVPKGTPFLWVPSNEAEFLFGRGHRFRVVDEISEDHYGIGDVGWTERRMILEMLS